MLLMVPQDKLGHILDASQWQIYKQQPKKPKKILASVLDANKKIFSPSTANLKTSLFNENYKYM